MRSSGRSLEDELADKKAEELSEQNYQRREEERVGLS